MLGGTEFHFVTDGIGAALDLAIRPVLLGSGERAIHVFLRKRTRPAPRMRPGHGIGDQ
ncbi:MAG: hypothetical protein ACHQIL_02850 [Steroidobacterales bacterium]